MPTLNRALDGSHYYIRSWYEGTWQVSNKALPEILSKYPLVERYQKEELPPSYLQHLKRQGWLYRTGEGAAYLAPWEYQKEQFADSLEAAGIPGAGYPELSLRMGQNNNAWQLGISIPPIPQYWVDALPEEAYRQLTSDLCWISVDGRQHPATNLLGEPFFASVPVRESQRYYVAPSSTWPQSIDASNLDCLIEPPSGLSLFQPPYTPGLRLYKPRMHPMDEIVVLASRIDARTRHVRDELDRIFAEADDSGQGISRGELQNHSNWAVYWIRIPKRGSRLWNLLEFEVGLWEASERWLLDMVTPLSTSITQAGVHQISRNDPILIRLEHSSKDTLGPEGRMLAWEQGGLLLRQVENKDNLNPHHLEITPPPDVSSVTLWVFGAGSSPAWLSFSFMDQPSPNERNSVSHLLSVILRFGNTEYRINALSPSTDWPEIEIGDDLDPASIQIDVDVGHEAIAVACRGRSLESFDRPCEDKASLDVALGNYLARMAQAKQAIELEFDAGAWGCAGVRFIPKVATKAEVFPAFGVTDDQGAVVSRWRAHAFASLQQRWVCHRNGRGRLFGSNAIDG